MRGLLKHLVLLLVPLSTHCQSNLTTSKSSMHYANGQLASSGAIYQGSKVGVWNYWYEDGTQSKIGFHKLSETTMFSDAFISDTLYDDPVYRDIYVQEQIDSVNGVQILVMNERYAYAWYASGTLKANSVYDLANSQTEYFEYYENGNLSTYSNFKHGLVSGISKTWSDTGILIESFSYSKGKLDGLGTVWDNNGTLVLTCSYVAGKEDGTWTYYNADSIVKKEIWKTGEFVK